eukprot:jgi/Chlat1/7660/Chrsp64S07129
MARSYGAAATAACMLLTVCLACAAAPALAQTGPQLSAYIETYDELKSLYDALNQSPAFTGYTIKIFFKKDITYPAGAYAFDFSNYNYALFSGKPNNARVTLTAAPGVAGFFFHSSFYGPFKASNIVFKNATTAAVSVRHLRAFVLQDMYFTNCGFVGNAAAVAYDFCYSKSYFRKCNFTNNKHIFTYTNTKLADQEPAAKIYMSCGSFCGKQGTLQSWSSVFPDSDSFVRVCPPTNAIKFGKNVESVNTCKC